jgi:hypothetical protein
MITVTTADYKNFGKCVEITNGKIIARITVDLGFRIIYYGMSDGRNVMCENVDRDMCKGGEYFDRNFGEGTKWYIYGGHRLWKSPEDMSCYVPDNGPVEYSLLKDGAEFTCPVQVTTLLSFALRVTMNAGGYLTVTHYIKNHDRSPYTCALWALSVLKTGGTEIIPANKTDTGLLPNNFLTLWPYSKLNDKRLKLGERYIFLSQDTTADGPFKLGMAVQSGVAGYNVDNMLFIKRFDYINGAVYPDNGCNFETYTSNRMLEMETLSPLYTIAPGATVSHTETWELKDNKNVRLNDKSAESALS